MSLSIEFKHQAKGQSFKFDFISIRIKQYTNASAQKPGKLEEMYKKSSNPSAVVPIDKYKDPNYDPFADDEFIADIRQTRDFGKRTGKYFDPSKWARNSDGFYEYQKDSQESIKHSKVRNNRFSNGSQNSEEEQSSESESVMMRKDKPLIRPEYKYKPGKQTQRRLSRKSDFDISIDLDAIDSYHSSQQEKQKEREKQKNEEKQQRKSVQQSVVVKSLSSGKQNSKQKKFVQQNLEHVEILPKLRLSQKRIVYKNQGQEMKQIKKEVERLSKKKDNYYQEDEQKEKQVRKDEIEKSPYQQQENRKEVSKKKAKNVNELKRLSVGRKSDGRSSEKRNHKEGIQIEQKKNYEQVKLQDRSPNDFKKTKLQANKSQPKSKPSLEKNKKVLKSTSRNKSLQVQKQQFIQPVQQQKKQVRLESKQMTNIQRGKHHSKQKRSTKVPEQEKLQKQSKPQELKKQTKQSKGQQKPKQSIFNRKKTGTNEFEVNRSKDQDSFHFSQSISSILSRSSGFNESPNTTLQQLAYGLQVERNVSQTNTELNRAQIEQSSSINNLFSKKNGDENIKRKNKGKSKGPHEGEVKKSFSQLTQEEKEERYARLLRRDKAFLTQSITKAAMKYHEDQVKQAKQRRKKQDKQFMQNMRKKRGREFQKVQTNDILDQKKLEKLQSKRVQSQDKQVSQNMQGFKKQKINVKPHEDNREKKNNGRGMEKQKKERQNKSPKQPKMQRIKSKNLSKQSDNKANSKNIEKSGSLQKNDAKNKTKGQDNQNDYQLVTFQERIERLTRQQEVQKQTQLVNREAKANDLKKKKKQRPERVKNQPIHEQDQETHFQEDAREEFIEPPKNEKRVKWQPEEPKPIEVLKRPPDMKKHKHVDEALNSSDEQKIDRNFNNQATRYPQRNRAPRLQFWKSQKPIYDSQRKLVGLQSKELYRLIGFNQDTCKLEDLQMEATIPKKDKYVQIIWLKKNQLMDFNGFDEKYQELTINVKGKRASEQDKRSIEVYQDGNLRNLIVPATIQSNTGNFTVQNIGEYIVQLQFTLIRNLDEYYLP